MKRSIALLSLLALLPGCVTSRTTVNQQLSREAAAQIAPGATATEVVELLGAPTDIVQLGHRSAYLYEFQQTKMTGFLAAVVGFMNSDTRSDRIWVFLGPGGEKVTHVGSSFDADRVQNGMPWSELNE
jgi:outer membrane protein assembly factor BamE (lipoprotein component of BamABCDE complex)